MSKIHLIVFNYNYNKHLLTNINYFRDVESKGVTVNIIDDQSPIGIKDLKRFFQNCYITKYPKSRYNSINQINALYFALENIKDINSNDYIWLMDADDIPIINFEKINYVITKKKRIYFFSRTELSQKIVPKRVHRFWISGVTTSTIVIKQSILIKYRNVLSTISFKDTWLDMRISCLSTVLKSEVEVSKMIICERIMHDENDSLNYVNNKFEIFKRVLKAIIYKQFLLWQKVFY